MGTTLCRLGAKMFACVFRVYFVILMLLLKLVLSY
jgi:hypothetical protein